MADYSGHQKRFTRRFSLPAVISAVYDSEDEDIDNDNDPDYCVSLDEGERFKSNEHPNTVTALTPIDDNSDSTDLGHKSRKRKTDTNTWQKNIRSFEYNTGVRKQVNGVSGSRKVGSSCKDTCKLSCRKKFTDEERRGIFDSYWGTNNHQRRRDFIVSHATIFKKRRSMTGGTPSRRSNTIHYFLPQGRDNIHVCKVYFLNTLDISDSTVKYNLKNSNHGLVILAEPKVPVNKTSDAKKQCVINHINSFPKVDSHYCRATTKRKYLDPSLNIKAMYRLYSIKCEEDRSSMVTESMYRYIFNTEFNLGLHTPGKDVCDTCTKYNIKKEPNTLTGDDDKNQDEHLKRKQQARNSKENDKTRGDGSITAVFDLQQVMTVPKLNIGSAYYLRKLNVYNLTVLELQSHQGHCYTWNETEGKRGTNEIASAITTWLAAKDADGFEHVILYSDSCGGQNRNRLMCTALIHFLYKAKNIKLIEPKFFESGHSQNECDAMHSCIELNFRKSSVYLPSGYQIHMKSANKRNPYEIHQLMHHNILDFDVLNSEGFKQNAFNGIISMHHIVYSKESTDSDVRVSFSEEIGGELKEKLYRKRGQPINFSSYSMLKSYTARLPIDVQKKNDLLKLMEFVPTDTKHFYMDLPVQMDTQE